MFSMDDLSGTLEFAMARPTCKDWMVLVPLLLTVPVTVILPPGSGTGGLMDASDTTAG
ncbi:hypothetical protein GXW82_33475 [Streptacidiphilus sp. 4-A2]|nr:hypothetical protein [Streptacidiphilus sp. 4-A2]